MAVLKILNDYNPTSSDADAEDLDNIKFNGETLREIVNTDKSNYGEMSVRFISTVFKDVIKSLMRETENKELVDRKVRFVNSLNETALSIVFENSANMPDYIKKQLISNVVENPNSKRHTAFHEVPIVNVMDKTYDLQSKEKASDMFESLGGYN